jgi:glutaredoxin
MGHATGRPMLSSAWLPRLVAVLALLIAITVGSVARAAPVLELYTRPGCPHCVEAKRWAQELRERRPGAVFVERDVLADAQARRDLEALVRAQRLGAVALPTFRVGDALVVGFDGAETTGRRVEALLDGAAAGPAEPGASCAADTEDACVDPRAAPAPLEDGAQPGSAATSAAGDAEVVDIPLLGRLDARRLGLPAFTIVLGLVDGFNPCAMWVLLFLLAMLVNLRDRKRIALIAGTFVLVSGLAYYAFMAAWLNAFLLVGLSRAAQLVLGAFAVTVGAVHVKDFFAFGKGISFSIPESAKPGIYARTRKIVAAKSLWLAVAGAFALAVVVNVIELLCTAGLPALYTQVLVQHRLSPAERYAYLALYDLAYMLDDGIMVIIAIVTLGKRKLQERGGRWLKLLSGATILVLGVLLLVAPQLLVW